MATWKEGKVCTDLLSTTERAGDSVVYKVEVKSRRDEKMSHTCFPQVKTGDVGFLVLGHSSIVRCFFFKVVWVSWLARPKGIGGQELGCGETACGRQGNCAEEEVLIGPQQGCPTIRAALPFTVIQQPSLVQPSAVSRLLQPANP